MHRDAAAISSALTQLLAEAGDLPALVSVHTGLGDDHRGPRIMLQAHDVDGARAWAAYLQITLTTSDLPFVGRDGGTRTVKGSIERYERDGVSISLAGVSLLYTASEWAGLMAETPADEAGAEVTA
ncbi:hypothetical protein ACFQ60_22570 [Streptomyces zhihengii]